MGKHSKLSPSTKWRLGKKVFLRLMEYLTPSVGIDKFMDKYFSSFRLLSFLGVNNIRATRVLNKNRLRKCTIIGDKQLQKRKKKLVSLNSAHQAKNLFNFDHGWLE